MYKDFFGLQKYPFAMTPDPGCVFMTSQHREAMAALVYAILSRKGLLVLSGEVGTGKTTVLSRVLRFLPPGRVQSSVVMHPTLTPNEFLELLMMDFGIPDVPASKAQRLVRLQNFLKEADREGKLSALIIDEAHKLSPEVLEEIRLLGNLDHGDQKLLQIVLAGQSELDDVLKREELRQIKQRVSVRVALKALSTEEVESYIRYRWTQAGGRENMPFAPAAVGQIGAWSKGVPRLINSICDNALLLAFAEKAQVVSAAHILQATADLDLAQPAAQTTDKKEVPGMEDKPVAGEPLPAAAPQESPLPMAKVPEIRVPVFFGSEPRPKTLWNRWAEKLGLT